MHNNGSRLLGLIVFTGLILTIASTANAQAPGSSRGLASGEGNNMIQGRIYFPSGQTASGRNIKVNLESISTFGSMSTVADQDGVFRFTSLLPGDYTVVVDAGSAYQSNRSYPGDNKIWAGAHQDEPGLPAFNSSTLGSLDPLPLGQHTVAVYWNFSAPHCDGFTRSQGSSCLPAGKTLVKQLSFTVVDPYADSSAAQSG